MKKRHAELLGTNDHNEILAYVMDELERLDHRVKTLEQAAEEPPKAASKKKD